MSDYKKGKKHIVVFQDEEGNVLKTSFVPHKEAADPPDMPEKKQELEHSEIRFQGWDQDISSVENNLVVKAIYKEVPKKYLVMFFHEDGKVIGTETVSYGEPAKASFFPEKKKTPEFEYRFLGWNTDLSKIEKDTMAKAVFEKRQRSFRVEFYHEDGTLLKEEEVLYGQDAHPPTLVKKEADHTWHYLFEGWNAEYHNITENKSIHAVFTPVYNEYTIRFFDEDAGGLKEEKNYHYGEQILYPALKKKGYTLCWSETPELAKEDKEIYAHWEFTNPAGKITQKDNQIYQIINPSVTNGAIRLLSFQEEHVLVRLPQKVKLGDYYYRIEEIGERAFAGCLHMKYLYLPDSIRRVRAKGLAGCRCLEKIIFGKGLHSIGEKAFINDPHLKWIEIPEKNLRNVHRRAYENLRRNVQIIKKKI